MSEQTPTHSTSEVVKYNTQDILNIIQSILIEVMELEEEELEIGLDTHFQDDLELESIEMIALGDALQERYQALSEGHSIDFARWLTQLSVAQLMELKVSDLVEWIITELNSPKS